MYYEINVSLNGRHFFATAERSIISKSQLIEMVPVFQAKFPEAEGYRVSATVNHKTGQHLDLSNLEAL